MFSSRVPDRLEPNRLARALERLRAKEARVVDLTESNPTRAGIPYPDDVLAPLADPAGRIYEPAPRGLPAARAAVARDYARRGRQVPAERVILTASTSEAYSFLFKLLCDPDDEVLVPRPSYPLFDHLTQLDGVRAASYALEYHGRWTIAFDSLERACSPATRAVLVVSPNNPTGSYLRRDELERLAEFCAARGLALVGDEVFDDYSLEDGSAEHASVIDQQIALGFGLGGLSKTVGLPQLKLAWIAAAGPDELVSAALERLELIGDTYLSVATPVQLAAGALLDGAAVVRDRIHQRIVRNDRALRRAAARHPAVEVLRAEGGWYAVLRVPATRGEEALALDLLERDAIVVHPGYFFDFPHEAFLVVSLLVEPAQFDPAVATVLARASA